MNDVLPAPPPRPALWRDLGLALLIAWLPLMAGGHMEEGTSTDGDASLAFGSLCLAGYIALAHELVRRAGEPYRRLGWRRIRPWTELCWASALFVGLWTITLVHARLWPATEAEGDVDVLGPLTALNLLYYVMGAVFEETFYRGLLWDRIRRLTRSPGTTVVATAVLFAATHPYALRDLTSVFLMGVLFGLVRWKGRSQVRLIVGHLAYNLSLYLW